MNIPEALPNKLNINGVIQRKRDISINLLRVEYEYFILDSLVSEMEAPYTTPHIDRRVGTKNGLLV